MSYDRHVISVLLVIYKILECYLTNKYKVYKEIVFTDMNILKPGCETIQRQHTEKNALIPGIR